MKLYLTHIGVIMLKHCPIYHFIDSSPRNISIKFSVNKYMRIVIQPSGVIHANEQLAAIDATHWMKSEANQIAEENSMEIRGYLEIELYKP